MSQVHVPHSAPSTRRGPMLHSARGPLLPISNRAPKPKQTGCGCYLTAFLLLAGCAGLLYAVFSPSQPAPIPTIQDGIKPPLQQQQQPVQPAPTRATGGRGGGQAPRQRPGGEGVDADATDGFQEAELEAIKSRAEDIAQAMQVKDLQDQALKRNEEEPETVQALQTEGLDSAKPPPDGSGAVGLWALNAADINGTVVPLAQFAAEATVVVNVASHCGYTETNYRGLQKLYEAYHDRGFQVLAFPCNQFMSQEPGTNEEIRRFALEEYNVTFPMFAKVDVNGPDAHPVYKFLKQHLPKAQGGGGGEPSDFDLRWNFQKFLVDGGGYPVKLYQEAFVEAPLEAEILKLLEPRPSPS
ncbi:unnamed protein product [Ostreobium quekettii]|uniref:Glutathione peroxidase n=1 Tax=Ostreobium quekettii TaxID=121088 RepID=A0A8S1IRF9_9CHLO|nr:unnamed protein product [Ostreobium quekettii]|eukprot:evm.model.scf_11.20 EVM.evm.TU.scf_11.20   scf_11:196877-201557(-)